MVEKLRLFETAHTSRHSALRALLIAINHGDAILRGALEAARQKFGFLPNLLGELAAAPSALKGYLALGELLSESSLGPIEQQIVLIAAAVVFPSPIRSSRRFRALSPEPEP